MSLIEKAFMRGIKKPMLNPTLTLTLVLHAKHNDVFHCLYEGKFLMSLRRSRVGPTSLAPTLAHLKLTLNTTRVFDSGVTGELLGSRRTNSQKRKAFGTGQPLPIP